MTFEDFVGKLRNEPFEYHIPPVLEQPVPEGYRDRDSYYSDVDLVKWRDDNFNYKLVPALTKRWTIGGQSGGSCWGGEHYSVSGEPEPEWDTLDAILQELCPNITFLHYKKIVAMADYRTCSDGGDYYGNYYNYGVRVLPLFKLWEYLSEHKLI